MEIQHVNRLKNELKIKDSIILERQNQSNQIIQQLKNQLIDLMNEKGKMNSSLK